MEVILEDARPLENVDPCDKLVIGEAQFSTAKISQARRNLTPPTPIVPHKLHTTGSKMRGKRSKQYRKLMQQYGLSFGFREPYQVLREPPNARPRFACKDANTPCLSGCRHD